MARQIIRPIRTARTALTTPLELPGTAAWYDLSKLSSLIYDGSNRLQLVADISGNSAVNGLVVTGSSGNSASIPDAASNRITGDIDLRAKVALADWTPASAQGIVGKWGLVIGDEAYYMSVRSTGVLRMHWVTSGGSTITKDSTVAPTVSDYSTLWIRATLDVDNGAAGNDVNFYTSTDGTNWTQLGTTVTTAGTTSVRSTSSIVYAGAAPAASEYSTGIFYRAQIYNGINGTLVFDADFTRPAKLASSFTESSSNAATVTINTSGDTGARICGARDLVQMTQAKQPILTISPGGNFATFDGSNDYLKSAPFSLSQPESIYFVGSQETFTNNDYLLDGNASDGGAIYQDTTSPNVSIFASSFGPTLTNVALQQRALLRAVINGASSKLAKNSGAESTGNAGVNNLGGFTLAARGSIASFGNITFSAALLRAAADSAATQNRIASYLMPKWGISG